MLDTPEHHINYSVGAAPRRDECRSNAITVLWYQHYITALENNILLQVLPLLDVSIAERNCLQLSILPT